MGRPLVEFAVRVVHDEPKECLICAEHRKGFMELICGHSCCSICMDKMYENERTKFMARRARMIREYEDEENRLRERRYRERRELLDRIRELRERRREEVEEVD